MNEIPLIERPCLIDPAAHPTECNLRDCKLYPESLDFIEGISYATGRSIAEVMESLGNPKDAILYAVWKRAIEIEMGQRKSLCRFEGQLPPSDDTSLLP